MVEPFFKGFSPGFVVYVPWFPPGVNETTVGSVTVALHLSGSGTVKTTTLVSATVASLTIVGSTKIGETTLLPGAV